MKAEMIWKLTAAAAMSCSAAAIAFAVVAGGCDGMIETTQGNQLPMKCHWTMIAAGLVSIIALVCSLMELFVHETAGRRALATVLGMNAVVLFLIPSAYGIGVCAMDGMSCHTMATGLKVISLCLLMTALVQLVRSGKKDAPTRDL